MPIIFSALTCTVLLWFLSKANVGLIWVTPLRSLSQLFALLGFVLMSLNLVLSTKSKFLEKIFHGLDRVYEKHHLFGSLAFIFILNHPLFLIFESLPDLKLASIYFIPGNTFSYNLGIIALFFMIIAFIFILLIRLPYHLWITTHRLLGITFLFAGFHSLLVGSDISRYLPLRLWILFFFLVGVLSSVYIIILYRIFGPKFKYVVAKIEKANDIVHVFLKPQQHPLSFHPGQFVYVSFPSSNVSPELHPFTISSSPDDDQVRLSIKKVGDYTANLTSAQVEESVLLYGPHGQFGQPYLSSTASSQFIWLAGGIGVTPFLSLLRFRQKHSSPSAVYFFYSFRNEKEDLFSAELNSLFTSMPNSQFYNWNSEKKGRISGRDLLTIVPHRQQLIVQMCGPQAMMEDIKKQLLRLGLDSQQIIYENFSLI